MATNKAKSVKTRTSKVKSATMRKTAVRKRFHENDELNEILCILNKKAQTETKRFSKEQKKRFIDNLVRSMDES